MPDGHRAAALAVLVLALVGVGFTGFGLAARLPVEIWWNAILSPAPDQLPQLLVHYTVVPRIAVALLSGAALALAGAVFQQSLRNPLASPATLGVSAGSQLALSLATLFAPELLIAGREPIALLGGLAAAGIVFALSWRTRFAPLTVILAGMVVAMVCGAAAAGLALFHERSLQGLFVWGSGALNQQDWSVAGPLAWRSLVLAGVVALTSRPLQLFDLDESARNLGVSVTPLRTVSLGLAVALTAVVVSAVGVIGFVGLAAPALARALGVRRFGPRLFWSALIGASILWVTDASLQLIEVRTGLVIPTGAATALIGAPVLLRFASRLRGSQGSDAAAPPVRRLKRPLPLLIVLTIAVALIGLTSLVVGPSPDGNLALASGSDLAFLLPWRWPRTVAAAAAGTMLGTAGLLLQQLTRNPIAGPDVLGVSAGAALGLVLVLFLAPAPSYGLQLGATGLGSVAVALVLLMLGRRRALAAEQLLVSGVALGAVMSALLAMLMAGGDPRVLLVANWLAGSVYDATPPLALAVAASAFVLVPASALVFRWLDIAPLGNVTLRALGASPRQVGLTLLALACALTAAATLAVGPLNFAGFLAPHLAHRLGFIRARERLAATAMIGGLVMIAADWIGRIVVAPYQVPAGLVGILLAAPLLTWLLQPSSRFRP